MMLLLAVGCSYKNTPVAVRERLAFAPDRLPAALDELGARYGCEAVILSTCNRVELYLARTEARVAPDVDLIAEFLAEFHGLPAADPADKAILIGHGPRPAGNVIPMTAVRDLVLAGLGLA